MVDFKAAGEACKAIFLATLHLKDRSFYNSGFSLISASAMPHCRTKNGDIIWKGGGGSLL